MKLTDKIMENTHAYRLWQAPFVSQKFAPVLAHNNLARVRRVLDVGCGPGTNTGYFATAADYLGIDLNPEYIEYARRRFKRNFIVADATRFSISSGDHFDFILVNSFLHHIDTQGVHGLLEHLSRLLADDGHIHIVDSLLPGSPSIARFIALADRGKFPRPVEVWLATVKQSYESVAMERYDLKAFGTVLWNMIYFKGRPKNGF